MGGSCDLYGIQERCKQGFGWERDQLENVGVDGTIILKLVLKTGERAWTRCIWLGKETSGMFLSAWQLTFVFHTMRGILE